VSAFIFWTCNLPHISAFLWTSNFVLVHCSSCLRRVTKLRSYRITEPSLICRRWTQCSKQLLWSFVIIKIVDFVNIFFRKIKTNTAITNINIFWSLEEKYNNWNIENCFIKMGHSSNCAATYSVELRQLSLFHGSISHVLRHYSIQQRTVDVALRCRLRHICYCAPLIFYLKKEKNCKSTLFRCITYVR
jgi:hypothetical protein